MIRHILRLLTRPRSYRRRQLRKCWLRFVLPFGYRVYSRGDIALARHRAGSVH